MSMSKAMAYTVPTRLKDAGSPGRRGVPDRGSRAVAAGMT
jgi:hypothetical protein